MELSRRITGLTGGGSDGWDIYYRAKAMIAEGLAVTELTIGEHDTPTDRSILDAMHRAALAGHTGYAAIPGIAPLREALARRVTAQTGVETSIGNVQIAPGGQSALFAAFHATCDDGDVALICDPYYATYPGTVRAVGAHPLAVPCRADDTFRPRPEAIRRAADAARGRARALLINSPNNPTGTVYDAETLAAIAEVCVDCGLWLISDEVYDTQVWDGTHLSPRALPGMADRVLVVGSMSKSHAMTGSRIGWLIAPVAAIGHLRTLFTHTTYGVPGFIQHAALFALSQGPAFEAAVAEPFRRRRDIAMRLLAGQNVVRAVPPGGAMYMMLDIRATGLSGEAFAHRLLDDQAIAVMPGESFGQSAAGHLRVAMTVDDARFEDAMGRLLDFAGRIT